MGEEVIQKALAAMCRCRAVIATDFPVETLNRPLETLMREAEARGLLLKGGIQSLPGL